MIDSDLLKVVLCGFEHSGTTLLSQILSQHPSLDCGFECGLLLAPHPKLFLNFEPYATHLIDGWKVTKEERLEIVSSSSWKEAYFKLRNFSRIIKNSHCALIDKTPKYMEELDNVLEKAPQTPCVVMVKDPRAQYWSWHKRANHLTFENELPRFKSRYLNYCNGLKKALENTQNKIKIISYENFCLNPKSELNSIFQFLQLEFNDSYLNYSIKFPNIYGDKISAIYAFDYKAYITNEIQEKILNETKEFSQYHFNQTEEEHSQIDKVFLLGDSNISILNSLLNDHPQINFYLFTKKNLQSSILLNRFRNIHIIRNRDDFELISKNQPLLSLENNSITLDWPLLNQPILRKYQLGGKADYSVLKSFLALNSA